MVKECDYGERSESNYDEDGAAGSIESFECALSFEGKMHRMC